MHPSAQARVEADQAMEQGEEPPCRALVHHLRPGCWVAVYWWLDRGIDPDVGLLRDVVCLDGSRRPEVIVASRWPTIWPPPRPHDPPVSTWVGWHAAHPIESVAVVVIHEPVDLRPPRHLQDWDTEIAL